ncbi:ArnT family glycosyltransferase [Konateibacter massiliensis]|uniref:ArnT family glycosyltransferase n=1 Tax=Konateibacter massiliensis TaxID=2002841 RepID=UPI000C14A167|nr:glycosyltransferase family 39 protein [Konateibacter massiliensis]
MKKAYDTIINFLNRFYIPIFVLLSAVLFYLCFYRLDVKWVAAWDEARHGINAYEMYKNKDFIVNTYNYENDYWNLKPPLSYWGIMLGFRLFGFQVFSLRFYSALCYFITCVAASLFVKRSSKLASLFTMGFFCASGLAFVAHMARAGDADSMYVMFFTLAMLAMMLIHENKKMLYVSGLCFALAFLTKSWHSGMIVIIGGLYLLLTGEIKKLKLKEWLFFFLSFSVPLLLWAIARFIADGPTFFIEMLQTDLLNRTREAAEGHEFPLAFYFEYIFKGYYQNMDGSYNLIGKDETSVNYIYSFILGICAVGAIYFHRTFQKENIKKFLGYVLWFFIPFVAFSLTKTKLVWYVYPTLIPLAMVGGIYTAKLLGSKEVLYKARWTLLVVAAFFLIKYTNLNVSAIQSVSGDTFQDFIAESVSQDSAYASSNAYLFLNGGEEPLSEWSQDQLFLGEISGDYRCMSGGIDGFLAEENEGVLYISADYYEQFKEELTSYTILSQTGDYYLLSNR